MAGGVLECAPCLHGCPSRFGGRHAAADPRAVRHGLPSAQLAVRLLTHRHSCILQLAGLLCSRLATSCHRATAPACVLLIKLAQPHTAQVVDLLCISDAGATRALRYYKWDVSKLQVMGFIATHVGR